MTRPRLILASTSPRRRQLLDEHGVPHSAVPPGIDDADLARPQAAPPHQWVAGLAYLKARAVLDRTGRDDRGVVLAADTTIVKHGQTLGTPRDREEARRILSSLEEGEHEVVTGVALLAHGQRTLLVDRAQVRVGAVGPSGLAAYLDSGDWRGKAGGYNLRERLAAGWPISFEGDPTSIMGLPMRLLLPWLRRLGL
ncbi:MAG: Maf family protein [Phycisphaerales bacterium]|nr:Maf family protein [Phycisphaerales bacterium]